MSSRSWTFLLSDPDRSRARTRLRRQGFLQLVGRLTARSTNRRFSIGPQRLVDILADGRLVLTGCSAARALAWDVPSTDARAQWPVEAYISENLHVALVEHYHADLSLTSLRSRFLHTTPAVLDVRPGPDSE